MYISKKTRRRLSKLWRNIGLPEPRTLSPIKKYIPSIPNPSHPVEHIAFVGTEKLGFDRAGKMRPQHYLPRFHKQATGKHNCACYYYKSCAQLYRNLHIHKDIKLTVILVYGEDKKHDTIPSLRDIERVLEQHSRCRVANWPQTGRILRDKHATNVLFRQHNIPVPRLVEEDNASSPVFSNARHGSNEPSSVIVSGKLNIGRYNTELIDTRVSFGDSQYYCSLRALTASGNLLDLWPRIRPVTDQDPSVHTHDMPKDPVLLNFFYRTVALPLRPRVEALCKKTESVLGLGFYAHDILYDAHRDELYICEVGFKFHDYDVQEYLGELRDSVPWVVPHLDGTLPERAADALFHSLD